ncbi:ermin [Python bivittatus]|uniref:Ermin n=1 Tax=Python bivittatus TaxID=176946 RepID=A0A9F2NVP7_PYTBI|nr:ermin [Python bivittatus]
MTEDIQTPTSMSEFNRNLSSEKPQRQVIDIIDQLANSSEILPYEITEINPGSPFIEENQEGDKQLAEDSAHEVSDGTKEHQGLHEKTPPLSTKEFQGEENVTSNLQDEDIYTPTETDEEQGKIQLNEAREQIKEETLLKDNESTTEEDWDGAEDEAQKENRVDSHKERQESNNSQCLPTSPSCTSQTEKYDEQPDALKKNDISRHSYSRYNTISYRKIRKGNTKQRIDEFESMMHS